MIKYRFISILVLLGVSSTAQANSPQDNRLQARDLDGDSATIEAYFDVQQNITWLRDTNIGLSQTFGLQRAPLTDYGSEVAENGAMSIDGLTAFISGMNQDNYFGYSTWRLPTALYGGDPDCSTQLDDGAITWGFGCSGAEVGSLNTHLEVQYAGIESSPFINVVAEGPWHNNERWLGSSGPAGRHFYHFGDEGELRFCGAGRCIRGFVWPVHDGDIGTPVTQAACIDTDADGWGWNGVESCFISIPPAGECIDTLPLNDGWGWNGATPCTIEVTNPVCVDSPPVNDGWGWDGVQSCLIDAMPVCVDSSPVGDGWGWDGVQSCVIETTCFDSPPVGDGWGWDGMQSCRISSVQLQRIDGTSPAVSVGAQYVAFNSYDSTLYPQDNGGYADVFLQNTLNDSVQLISAGNDNQVANNHSYTSAMSANGQQVLFGSWATNLTVPSGNGSYQHYLYDTQTDTTRMMTVDSNATQGIGDISEPQLSADGAILVFMSDASNLVANDQNGTTDIFLHNTTTSETMRLTETTDGNDANGSSELWDMSANGRYVLFESSANNLLDDNQASGVFIYDTIYNSTQRIPADLLTGNVIRARVSDDGYKIVYLSSVSFTDGTYSIRVVDTQIGSMVDSIPAETGRLFDPAISPNGRYIAFTSTTTSLVDTPLTGIRRNIFLKDLNTGVITLVTATESGLDIDNSAYCPHFTANNSHLYFTSNASNLVSGDNNGRTDTFIYKLPDQ